MTEKDRYDHGLPPVRGTGTCFCKSVFRHLDRKTSMSRTREGSVTVQSGMDREPFESPFLRAKNSLFCTKLCYLGAVCPSYGWFLKDRKAIQEPVEFFGRYVTHIIPCPGPFHTAFLDPFVKENESVAFPAECFETILPCPAEKKEHILLERSHQEMFFYKSGKTVDPFAEICTPAANVYFSERCSLQHDLTALMILIRNSSLAPSDNRMSVFPALIQAETTGNVCSAWAGF